MHNIYRSGTQTCVKNTICLPTITEFPFAEFRESEVEIFSLEAYITIFINLCYVGMMLLNAYTLY